MRKISIEKIQRIIKSTHIEEMDDRLLNAMRDGIETERISCKMLVIEFPHEKLFRTILRDLDVIEMALIKKTPITLSDLNHEYGDDVSQLIEDVINSKVSYERAKYLLKNRDSNGRIIRNFSLSNSDKRELYPDGMTAGEFIYLTKLVEDNTEYGVEKGLNLVITLSRTHKKII